MEKKLCHPHNMDPGFGLVLKAPIQLKCGITKNNILPGEASSQHPVNAKGPVPFTQLVKVRRGKLVLALPSIRLS